MVVIQYPFFQFELFFRTVCSLPVYMLNTLSEAAMCGRTEGRVYATFAIIAVVFIASIHLSWIDDKDTGRRWKTSVFYIFFALSIWYFMVYIFEYWKVAEVERNMALREKLKVLGFSASDVVKYMQTSDALKYM